MVSLLTQCPVFDCPQKTDGEPFLTFIIILIAAEGMKLLKNVPADALSARIVLMTLGSIENLVAFLRNSCRAHH